MFCFSEQAAIYFSTQQTECVYSAVQTRHLNTIQVNFIIELILHKALIRSKMTSASPDWRFQQTLLFFLVQCLQNTVLRSTDSYPNAHIDPRFACGFPNSVFS